MICVENIRNKETDCLLRCNRDQFVSTYKSLKFSETKFSDEGLVTDHCVFPVCSAYKVVHHSKYQNFSSVHHRSYIFRINSVSYRPEIVFSVIVLKPTVRLQSGRNRRSWLQLLYCTPEWRGHISKQENYQSFFLKSRDNPIFPLAALVQYITKLNYSILGFI